MDGRQEELEGVSCMVANAGNLGLIGLSLAPGIRVGDGLLDVIVVRKADLSSLLQWAAGLATGSEPAEAMVHWQAREVSVASDPPQTVHVDGEVLGKTPFTARILPQALKVIVPARALQAG
jgi:diacylglycerol kinase family enzyme